MLIEDLPFPDPEIIQGLGREQMGGRKVSVSARGMAFASSQRRAWLRNSDGLPVVGGVAGASRAPLSGPQKSVPHCRVEARPHVFEGHILHFGHDAVRGDSPMGEVAGRRVKGGRLPGSLA